MRLNKLAYFNLFLVIIYLLVYLRSGTFTSAGGGLAIIIFNWLGLRSYETSNYRWFWWHYVLSIWTLYYIGTVLYGAINVLLPALEYQFADNSTITFIAMSIFLSVGNVCQAVLYFKRHLAERGNRAD